MRLERAIRVLSASEREIVTDAGRACACGHGEMLHQYRYEDVAGACLEAGCNCTQFAAPTCFTLRQLYEDPELLRPPEMLIPRLVWRGRSTMLSGREKSGKSSLIGFATALASRGGNIFGRQAAPLRVLLVSLEEHLGDVAQRYKRLQANPDSVYVVPELVGEKFAALRALVREIEPDVVTIDTLPAFAEGLVDDPNNPSTWTPIMQKLTRVARDGDLGMLLLQHARKSDGRYRDSTAIGAGVDMILEMIEDELGSTERRIHAKGRWQLDSYTIRYDAASGIYDVVASEQAPLEIRVLDYVRAHPNVSKAKLRNGIGGKNAAIDAAVAALGSRGLVLDVGGRNGHSYVAESLGATLGATPSENGKSLQDKAGQGWGKVDLAPDPNPIGSGGKDKPWDCIAGDEGWQDRLALEQSLEGSDA